MAIQSQIAVFTGAEDYVDITWDAQYGQFINLASVSTSDDSIVAVRLTNPDDDSLFPTSATVRVEPTARFVGMVNVINVEVTPMSIAVRVTDQVNSLDAEASQSTTSSTFADIGNGTTTGFAHYTFTAPTTQTYTIATRVSQTYTLTVGGANAEFRLVVDGAEFSASRIYLDASGASQGLTWVGTGVIAAGTHTLKVQYRSIDNIAAVYVDGVFSSIPYSQRTITIF